ncbi:MAG: acetyl-CoA carboxylase biotin carboxyl carrier protein subunit [Bryobacteraceae bacterium]
MPDKEEPVAAAAATAVGGHPTNSWARHAREDLQASHSLTAPLARWAPEPVEAPLEAQLTPDASATEPEIAIPESVFHARPQHRLAEDAVCRSPICGQVIAVMAAAGQSVIRHEAVLVIEAMKMQNYVGAEVDGVLKAVLVSPGDAVKAGQVLFELV